MSLQIQMRAVGKATEVVRKFSKIYLYNNQSNRQRWQIALAQVIFTGAWYNRMAAKILLLQQINIRNVIRVIRLITFKKYI